MDKLVKRLCQLAVALEEQAQEHEEDTARDDGYTAGRAVGMATAYRFAAENIRLILSKEEK
mgnify:CR=1 FL=1